MIKLGSGSNLGSVMDWKNVDTTNCGIRACVDIIGDKWSFLILRDIYFGVNKFQDLQSHIGASSTIIAQRLKKLLENNLLLKSEYQHQGSRKHFEYILTDKGKAVAPLLIAMSQFGYDFLIDEDKRLSSFVDIETGEHLRLALVDTKGIAVPSERVQLIVNVE